MLIGGPHRLDPRFRLRTSAFRRAVSSAGERSLTKAVNIAATLMVATFPEIRITDIRTIRIALIAMAVTGISRRIFRTRK